MEKKHFCRLEPLLEYEGRKSDGWTREVNGKEYGKKRDEGKSEKVLKKERRGMKQLLQYEWDVK
jgi:hypothetical protein